MRYINIIRGLINHQINFLLIRLFGKKWNVVLINEYPKCGASWVRKMISDYLEVEHENGNNNKAGLLQLIGKNAIIQRHWLNRNYNVKKTILIIRDPRDVYNSYYFHETYFNAREKLLNNYGYDKSEDDKSNMTKYIKFKLEQPEKNLPGFSYMNFWKSYKQEREELHIVKYEDLQTNVFNEFKGILGYLGVTDIDENRINQIIDKYSFKNMSKRKKGVENKSSHSRKGIVGDWKNYYTEETIELMKKHVNELILDMEYEQNENW